MAASGVEKSTKPKPRLRPVSFSVTTRAPTRPSNSANSLWSHSSSTFQLSCPIQRVEPSAGSSSVLAFFVTFSSASSSFRFLGGSDSSESESELSESELSESELSESD